MSKGYMYILECADGSYYTGSTKDLERRFAQHQAGEGANHTKKRLPVKLVYYEEYQRIDYAFYREKQVQGWSRKKKEALINGEFDKLNKLAECKNDSHYEHRASTTLSPLPTTLSPLPATLSPLSESLIEQNELVERSRNKVVKQNKTVERNELIEQNELIERNEVVERSRNHNDDNLKELNYGK